MSAEIWRRVLARWGDPSWAIAILYTGHAETAETAVVDTFCSTFREAAPDDPEQALYQALTRRRLRFDRVRRRPALSAGLRRVAPADRALLGLWLLRDHGGERIAAITGLSVDALVPRLAAAVAAWADARFITGRTAETAELAHEITQRLHAGGNHLRSYSYTPPNTLLDRLRAELHDLTRAQHLPANVPARVEQCLKDYEQTTSVRWWQRSGVWQAALVGLTILVLALLITPRGVETPQLTAAPPTARALVEGALQAWSAPRDEITHLRVWAIDPRRMRASAVTTDVWRGAGDSAEHRIEVRRGNRLLEWQIADGTRRLSYGAVPAESACPWMLPRDPSEQVAASFRVPTEEQRAALDARLQEGAYGLGYLALQRALAAPDLRSFGTRIIASRTFVTLIYSDTYWGPSQQVVLRIDPATRDLWGVQAVSVTGAQTRTRDLWRLDVKEDVTFIQSVRPDWVDAEDRSTFVDPHCLLLSDNQVGDLRATIGTSDPRWYLPHSLPSGTARVAVVVADTAPDAPESRTPTTVQFAGPGRAISISEAAWQPSIASPSHIDRGIWRIAILPQEGRGPIRAVAHVRPEYNAGVFPRLDPEDSGWSQEQTLDSFVATVGITAQGVTEDELLAIVDQLAPATATTWMNLREATVATRSLDSATLAVLDQAITALQPPADGTIITHARTEVGARNPRPKLSDPYQIAPDLWSPSSAQRTQTLVYQQGQPTRFDDQQTTTNGTLYNARYSDGTRFLFRNRAAGWMVEGDAQQLGDSAYPEQPGMAMLTRLLASADPITATEQNGSWLIEHSIAITEEDLRAIPDDTWDITPWTVGLATGTITDRLWLDRVTALPQRLEMVHGAQGTQTSLLTTTITERRVTDAADTTTIPATEGDELVFRWRPGSGAVLDQQRPGITSPASGLAWEASSGVTMQWDLHPVASDQLTLSAFAAPRWFNLSRLSAIRRTLYRVDEDNSMGVMVTQGPKALMQHVLRYSETHRGADGLPWTASRRLPVTIGGVERDAWLLANEEIAAIVIDMDDQLVHIMGLRSYLEGPLLPALAQLKPAASRHPPFPTRGTG